MNWPATLPPFRIPLDADYQDGTIRTSMDAGPTKIRPRFTAVSKFYRVPLRLTGAELGILESFYFEDLQQGSLEFSMQDPVSGVSSQFRFSNLFQPRLRTGSETPAIRIWDVTLTLEKLP